MNRTAAIVLLVVALVLLAWLLLAAAALGRKPAWQRDPLLAGTGVARI